MARLIATEGFRTSNLVKHEYEPSLAYCREVATYTGAAKTFVVGELVTATGGVPANAGAIFGIVMEETTAPAATATRLVVLERGPAIVSRDALVLGSLAINDVVAALAAKGIKVNDTV